MPDGKLGAPVSNILSQFMTPVNPAKLFNQLISGFGGFVQGAFSIIYMMSEIGILAGIVVFIAGAAVHHRQIKGVGGRIVVFSILGFLAALFLPGLILTM